MNESSVSHGSKGGDSRQHDTRVPSVSGVPQGYILGLIKFSCMFFIKLSLSNRTYVA